MHITGRYHRLMKLFTQLNHLFIQSNQILLRVNIPVLIRCNHKFVVSDRLYLEIVIETHNPCNLFVTLSIQKRPEKLTRLTGAAYDQSLPVFFNQALGNQRSLVKIFQMGL